MPPINFGFPIKGEEEKQFNIFASKEINSDYIDILHYTLSMSHIDQWSCYNISLKETLFSHKERAKEWLLLVFISSD